MGETSWITLLTAPHEHGTAAVYRDPDDGSLWLTGSLDDGGGTELDPYEVTTELFDSLVIAAGMLPTGAASVELRDREDQVHSGTCGEGVWIVLFESAVTVWDDPPVLFRDATGAIVRRPLPADAVREPLPEADTPCPACGGPSWEFAKYEVEIEGEKEERESPICIRCGHPEAGESVGGEAYVSELGVPDDGNANDVYAGLEKHLGRALPDEIKQGLASSDENVQARAGQELSRFVLAARGASFEEAYRERPFAVYALDGRWTGERSVVGWGSHGEHLNRATIRHASSDQADDSWVLVETENLTDEDDGESLWPSLTERAEQQLEEALESNERVLRTFDDDDDDDDDDDGGTTRSGARHRAVEWLREAKDSRATARRIAQAPRLTLEIRVDGQPHEFLIVHEGDFWGGAAQRDDLVIELAGSVVSPKDIGLVVVDPLTYLRNELPGTET